VVDALAPCSLTRLPLVFKVAIISPHGYFGQHNVLGMPDTGGQVRASN
jgi:sucrose synthase